MVYLMVSDTVDVRKVFPSRQKLANPRATTILGIDCFYHSINDVPAMSDHLPNAIGDHVNRSCDHYFICYERLVEFTA